MVNIEGVRPAADQLKTRAGKESATNKEQHSLSNKYELIVNNSFFSKLDKIKLQHGSSQKNSIISQKVLHTAGQGSTDDNTQDSQYLVNMMSYADDGRQA